MAIQEYQQKIGKNARAYRELGIGYANLGAMLMAMGLPYDSDEGRAIAAAVTALLTGTAYATSAEDCRQGGPICRLRQDREGMIKILKQHRAAYLLLTLHWFQKIYFRPPPPPGTKPWSWEKVRCPQQPKPACWRQPAPLV